MDIKAMLLDFDGTALQKDQVYISFRNMKAINAAMARGIEIIPCTGRCEDMLPPQIEADKEIRYWITANGARVVDRKTREAIYTCVFTPDESAMLCKLFEDQNIYSEISANGLIYMEENVCANLGDYPVPAHHVWFLELGRQVEITHPSTFFKRCGIGIEKVNLYGVPEKKQQPLIQSLLDTGIVDITGGAGAEIQFFPKRLERINALDALMKRLGIGYENIMSIGDSLLDKTMIDNAKIGVAMGNAPDIVKEGADYVTASFDKDGVAEAIEKFLL